MAEGTSIRSVVKFVRGHRQFIFVKKNWKFCSHGSDVFWVKQNRKNSETLKRLSRKIIQWQIQQVNF